MAVLYLGNVVLVEHAESEGNFPTVTRLLLCRLPTNRQRMSYVYDRCGLGERAARVSVCRLSLSSLPVHPFVSGVLVAVMCFTTASSTA